MARIAPLPTPTEPKAARARAVLDQMFAYYEAAPTVAVQQTTPDYALVA